jgi:hypothetical protein
LGAPFAPPNACRAPAASTPARASLSPGRTMRSSQPSIRPPSLKTTASPTPPPVCGTLLVSLDFYKIAPIGAAAELQDIGGQRGEAAMGCYPPGLSAIFWCTCFLPSLCFFLVCSLSSADVAHRPPVALSVFFSTCRPPVAATLRPRSVCAHNRSLHVAPAAAHCSDARKRVAQEPGDHRFSTPDPIGPVAYGTRPIGAILCPFNVHIRRPRSTSPHRHPTFLPRCTTHGSTASACLQRPAHINPACRHLRVSAKLGLPTEHSGVLVLPGARTTSPCEPGSIAPHRRTV